VSDKTSQKEIKESVSKSGKSKSSSTLKNETLQKEKPCPNPAHRKNKPSLSKAGKRMSSDTQKQAQKMKSEMDFLSCLADQKLLPTDEDNRMTNKPVYKRYGKYLNAINGQSESCGKYIVIIEQHIKGLKEKIIGDLNAKPENSEKRQFFNDIETHLTNQNNTKNDLDDFLIATDEKIKEEDISSDIFSEMTAHCTSFNKLCREMDQLANLIICIEILASDNCNQTDVRNWRASIIAQSKKLQLGNVKALLAAIKKAKKASFDSTKGTKLVPRALELEQTGNVSISSDKNGMSLGEKRIPIKNLSQAVFKWFTGDTCPLKGTILNLLIDQDSLENLQSGIQFIETGKNKFAKVRDFFKQEKNDLEKHVNDKDPSKAAIVQLIKAQGIAQIENLQTAMEKLENKVEPIGATSGAIDVNSVEDYANQFNALCFNAYCLCKTISHAITQIENVKCDFDEKSLKNIADQVKDYQVNKNPFIESSLPLINLENIVIATPEISKENASAPVTQEEQKSFFGKILGFLWK
jgi:hypothetical protein